MKEYIAIFFVGFFSDLVLNYLSRQNDLPDEITSLRDYFEEEGAFSAAVKAGLTTLFCGRIAILISPAHTLFYKALSGFGVGYVADWVIYRCNTFGKRLEEYYETAGVGFWGGAAIAFAVFLSEIAVEFF